MICDVGRCDLSKLSFGFCHRVAVWQVDELCLEKDNKAAELDWLLSQSAEDLWTTDLDALAVALDEFENDEKQAMQEAMKINKGAKKGKPIGRAKPKKKKNFDSDDDDDDVDDFEDDESDEEWGGKGKKAKVPKKEKSAPARTAAKQPAKKAEAAKPAAPIATAPWLEPKPVVEGKTYSYSPIASRQSKIGSFPCR